MGQQGTAAHARAQLSFLTQGMKSFWEQPPTPRAGLDHEVPFLLSQNEVESSLVSPFVKPESFNSTFSLNDAVFYMKIRASKTKYPRWQQALPKDTASGC